MRQLGESGDPKDEELKHLQRKLDQKRQDELLLAKKYSWQIIGTMPYNTSNHYVIEQSEKDYYDRKECEEDARIALCEYRECVPDSEFQRILITEKKNWMINE